MTKSFHGAGISRWREIVETLTREIDQGVLVPGDKLPAEVDLVDRFGVARQTIRRALAHLKGIGFIDVQLGRGTFVTKKVFEYRIEAQKSLEQNLVDNAMLPSRELLSVHVSQAPRGIAEKLEIETGSAVLCAEMLGRADGSPVALVTAYYPLERIAGLETAFAAVLKKKNRLFSQTKLLESLGVNRFSRRYIRIKSRFPSPGEMKYLGMSSIDIVVETSSVSDGDDGRPVFFAMTSYHGSRVEFYVGKEDFQPKQ